MTKTISKWLHIIWAVLAATGSGLFLWALYSTAVFNRCLDAAFGFMRLMAPGMDKTSVWYALLPIALVVGWSALCTGCIYAATRGKLFIGAVYAAMLTASPFLLIRHDTMSVSLMIAGGSFGCLAAIAAYGFLTKKLPSVFNRETISYIVFGVLTTVVSFVSQMLFASMGTPAVINTIGSWVCAVIFAYIVNKLFVFESHTDTKQAFLRELWLFFAARLASLGMELVFMGITVDWLGFSEAVCKLIAQVFILVANYIFSKLIIFRKKKE